jgi:hypothetical protein
LTYRTPTEGGRLLLIVGLPVLTSLVLQLVFKFGPLWLVTPERPQALSGPFVDTLTP